MSHIGNLNPYRYRGYRYDNETRLFYLNSRYYNPEIARFINANSVDVLNIDQDSLLENNLFAYCLNNPVKMIDKDGKVAQIAVILGVTALLIFTVPDFYNAMKNPNSKNIFLVGLGVVPAGKLGKVAAPVKKIVAVKIAKASNLGFESFTALKRFLGSAGAGNEWHHIIEQSQIAKSGFSPFIIHNTNNAIAISRTVHNQISGYYSTKTFQFTKGLSVRDWLAGQSYQKQYEFGINVLKRFGVIR